MINQLTLQVLIKIDINVIVLMGLLLMVSENLFRKVVHQISLQALKHKIYKQPRIKFYKINVFSFIERFIWKMMTTNQEFIRQTIGVTGV